MRIHYIWVALTVIVLSFLFCLFNVIGQPAPCEERLEVVQKTLSFVQQGRIQDAEVIGSLWRRAEKAEQEVIKLKNEQKKEEK